MSTFSMKATRPSARSIQVPMALFAGLLLMMALPCESRAFGMLEASTVEGNQELEPFIAKDKLEVDGLEPGAHHRGDGNRRLLHERIIGVTVIPDGDFDTTLEKPHTKPKPAPSQKEEASQASNNAAGTGADDGRASKENPEKIIGIKVEPEEFNTTLERPKLAHRPPGSDSGSG